MSIRRALGASALAAVVPAILIAGSVQPADAAADAATSSITVMSSDYTPASGQTFASAESSSTKVSRPTTSRSRSSGSSRAPGAPSPAPWSGPPATASTRCTSSCETKGVRDLRVVGVTAGAAHDAFKRFTETVH